MRHVWCITWFFLICWLTKTSKANYTLCITTQVDNETKSACDSVGKELCIVENNGIDCIRKIEKGEVITVAHPDEAILASSFTNKTFVAGYLKDLNSEDDVDFTMVVLSNKKLNGFNGLKYCHLGNEAKLPTYITTKFENFVWSKNPKNLCHNSDNFLENYFYNMNETFESSCIPGRWSIDDQLDADLKIRYPKLLELCHFYKNNTNVFEQSLNCLMNGKGNVALSTLKEVKIYEEKGLLSNMDYYYICENGNQQPLNISCSWSKYPFRLVLANTEIIDELTLDLREFFPKEVFGRASFNINEQYNKKELLSKALFSDSLNLHLIDHSMSLKEYITDLILKRESTDSLCYKGVSWCVSTEDEKNECIFIQNLINTYGMEPRIKDCQQLRSTEECIESVMKNNSDITYISSDQLYNTRKYTNKVKLDPILYSIDDHNDLIRTVLIVNEMFIKAKSDLENKTACFTGIGSIDWLSFSYFIKDEVKTESCSAYENLRSFVSESCMPGVNVTQDAMNNKLCSLCPSNKSTTATCNYDFMENAQTGNNGALDCLRYKNAEYAVIKMHDDFQLPDGAMIMCKNGTLSNSSEIDDECFLSISPRGAFVVAESNILKNAIQTAFIEMKAFHRSDYNLIGNSKGVYPHNPNLDAVNVPAYIQTHSGLIENIDSCIGRGRYDLNNIPKDVQPASSNKFLTTIFVMAGLGAICGAAVFGWFKVKDGTLVPSNPENIPGENAETNRHSHSDDEIEMVPLKIECEEDEDKKPTNAKTP
ncbi:transferrin-like [Onthophagus taurus]|uniref:transferrin-like n=1 Tax=Onthophagus taurus TaxID=166361 RepID=UPI0039BE6608